MKKIYILISLLVLVAPLYSQITEGDIEDYLNNIISNMPGSSGNNYVKPTNNELDIWNDIIDEILINNIASANDLANSINYQIVEFVDITLSSNNYFYIIEESLPQNKYWGTYVISKDPLRSKLILQAPHPVFDTNTGPQAIFCFKRLQAKALFLSGTHRCNHSQFSDCSGTTSVCGGVSSPYRISDNAHNTQSVFQRITEKLYDETDSTVFVQLHGFAKYTSDPYLIMSNGTRITPDIDYNALIMEGLLLEDPILTFKIAHLDLSWDRLIAFSNTQGRYINNSADPCYQNATSSDGRFVHIEQEKYRLRQDSTGWFKMYSALEYAFNDNTSTKINSFDSNEYVVFPNPAKDYIYINTKDTNIDKIHIYNVLGILMKQKKVTTNFVSIPVQELNEGIYILNFITKDNKTFSRRILIERY